MPSRPACALVLACALVFVGSSVRAEGFAFRQPVGLGRPAREIAVVVRVSPEGTVLEMERGHWPLPVAEPERAELTRLALPGGVAVAVLRVHGVGNRETAALLGRNTAGQPSMIWAGALDLRGDPGERTASVLEIRAAAGDRTEVFVGEIDERIRLCGQPRTLLHPRVLDPSSLQLRPAPSSFVPASKTPAVELAAKSESPGPTGAPLLQALFATAASNSGPAATASPTSALTDRNPTTYWNAGAGGEFVTFHVDAGGYPIRTLGLTLLPQTLPPGAVASAPRGLWLIGDAGAQVHVQLPDATVQGQRYFVVPEQPLTWGCISVVVDPLAATAGRKHADIALTEVEAYTELDFGGGTDRLLRDLAAGGAQGSRAASLLPRVGAEIAPKLRAAWPQLSEMARRQVVHAVAAFAEKQPEARELLAVAASDSDSEVSKGAFDALVVAGPASRALLLPRIAQADAAGDSAALALARHAPREAIAVLLEALRGEGLKRRALHEAISVAVQSGGDEMTALIRAFCATEAASPTERAALAVALSRLDHPPTARALAGELADAGAPKAESFEDRWRWVAALRSLPASPELDGWLTKLAREDERWMLRASALEALAERQAAQRVASALEALDHDQYPRVRMVAAQALAKEPSAAEALTKHAGRDSWPMVRAAALEALAGQSGSQRALELGLDDRAHQVRAAAIRSLERAGLRGSWPLVARRLNDQDEWSEVKTEGVHFARAFCLREAADPLLALLRRGIAPEAGAEEADLALLAFEAVSQLGGEPAKRARALAGSSTAPAAFKASVAVQDGRKAECAKAQ
ncbi:MAG: HEAT repeat domain-containing protein [Polyangiales bacterium]